MEKCFPEILYEKIFPERLVDLHVWDRMQRGEP